MPTADQFTTLEFDRLLNQLSGYAGSPLTRALIRNIHVEFHPSRIDENLDQTAEALHFQEEHPAFILPPFSQVEDLTELLERIAAGEIVDPQQAKSIVRFLQTCMSFDSLRNAMPLAEYPRLADVASAWQSQAQLHSLAKRIFSEDGEVRDSASPELAELRAKLGRFEGDMSRSVRDLIRTVKERTGEDANMAIRGNRFVVLMPRSMVREFQGSVVDISGSGQNIYFEPTGVATLNAERQHLFLEEDQEVRRILREFGMQVISRYESLKANLSILAKYDYIFARGAYSRAVRGTRPRMNRDGRLHLRGAIHPLLFKEFVPEDLRFETERALIISGVNAGGKTVLLKLLGLYCLLAALGCYVPGDAELPYISGLQADIGDDQSTLHNLSTFTAHLRFIEQLWQELSKLGPGSLPTLVLIDEIGTGTEPSEGSAFAYGLITTLLEFPVKLAVTTHYDMLKTLAFERSGVKNVSLEFDQTRLKPTYRILDDQPGRSFALAIAQGWGIDQRIVETAHSVIGSEEKKMAAVIGELEDLRRDAELARRQASEQALELERLKKDNIALNQELRDSKQRFVQHSEQVKVELDRRIDELLVDTKRRLKKKAQQSARQHEEYVKAASQTAEVVRQQKEEASEALGEALEELQIELAEILSDDPVQVGDRVAVEDSRVRGIVLEINRKKGEAVLEVSGKRVQVRLKKLRKASTTAPVAMSLVDRYKSGTSSKLRLEEKFTSGQLDSSDAIDLHGQTTEEAQESLDEFISTCLVNGTHTIRIMHGIGTGRLRSFVQDYLRKQRHITNVRFAPLNDGGVGVTLADLR